MKNKKTIILILVIVFSFILGGCGGAKPDSTVKNFFKSVKKSDIKSMATYMSKDSTKDAKNDSFKYTDADQEKVAKDVFSKVSYVIVSSKISGKNATVKTKVTSLDLPQIYGKLVSDMMPTLFTQALAGNTTDSEAQIMTAFINAINAPNAPKTTIEVDIKLKKEGKGWLIVANDDLLNALTGNMSKAFPSSSSDSDVKSDPKIYAVNEEAKIGRTAITVTKFELSNGKEYDTPKEGYIYAVLTLKKKNTSKDLISYTADEFKIQNDKGQIIDHSYSDIGKAFGEGNLAVGGEVEGNITFEVPMDSASLTFMFYPSNEALLKFKVK